MSKVIAVSGKGGTGKTTLAALLVRVFKEAGTAPILAVDADPNAGLAELLGVNGEATIGDICEEAREKDALQSGMTKNEYLKFMLEQIVVEEDGFDLLTMGRPEGPGCYCYANNVLRESLKILLKNYALVIIDNEAGFEHISRKTNLRIDELLIVSDPSVRGIATAKKIIDLTKKIKLPAARTRLIINRLRGKIPDVLLRETEKTGLELLAGIVEDEILLEDALAGRSVFSLPEQSAALKAVQSLTARL